MHQSNIFRNKKFQSSYLYVVLFVASSVTLLCTFTGFINPSELELNSAKPAEKWVGTWSTAPQLVEHRNMPPASGLSNNTIRQVVRVSAGGKTLRIRFSNEFSKSPVEMKAIQIAVSKGGGTIEESTSRNVKFNKKNGATIKAGATITSDPLSFDLKPGMEVAITISFGQTASDITGHPGSRTTSYLLQGEHTSSGTDFINGIKTEHWYIINGIDVQLSEPATAIAIIGDSITDGRGSGTDKQNRWPDILANCLLNNSSTSKIGVLNMGIGGNCVLRGGLGPTALSRFERDILNQSGVRWLIISEGVNDLGGTHGRYAAEKVGKDLIDAYKSMIDKAHAQGIKVYGATITPIKKSFYYTDYRDSVRDSVNQWIRNSGYFDAVIDFDKSIRNPADTLSILPEAQSGDYLHPNELGYRMMGKAIDLSLFEKPYN